VFVEGRAKSRALDRPAGGARANSADGFADGRPGLSPHPFVIPTKVGTQGTTRNARDPGS
jgi:hypothetical protein